MDCGVVTRWPSKSNLILYRALALLMIIALCACSNLSSPTYTRPEIPEKQQWSGEPDKQSTTTTEPIMLDWWRGFDDAYLNNLIAIALANNIDIKIIARRIELADSSVDGTASRLFPQFNATTGMQYQKQKGMPSSKQYNLQSTLSWELDIWGRVNKRIDAEEAAYKASEADWRAAYLRLVADVATTYFQIRQFDEQLEQLRVSSKSNLIILANYEAQRKEGIISSTKVLSQRAEINRLRGELLSLERQRQIRVNNLATLLGEAAGTFNVPIAPLRRAVKLISVPVSLPADLLSRRPDVIAAEYRVLRAHHLIGEAKLARLPSFSLTGNAGGSSDTLSTILKQWTLGLSPSFRIPIFDKNLKITVRNNEIQAKIAEDEYRRIVIKAFEEVENTLVSLSSNQQQKSELQLRLKSLRIVSSHIHARLKEGMVSQLEVFESERTLLSAEQALLRNHQQILTDTVTLYKALGGGWPAEMIIPRS